MKQLAGFLIFIIFSCPSFSQETTTPNVKPAKTGQDLLFNEVYSGYGAGSIFYFTGRMNHSYEYESRFTQYNGNYYSIEYTNPKSFGTLFAGYSRSLNRVISMGFIFGYQSFTYTGELSQSAGSSSSYTMENTDILLTGIARFTFSYLNKPHIRMYSGIGIGVTVGFGKEILQEGLDEYSEMKLYPSGQATFMGVRFGGAFGGFFEFGIGTIGILNAGLSYKFSD